MIYNLIWSPNALKDMEKLYDFYAGINLEAAVKIYNGILDEVVILEKNPKLGPIEDTLKHRSKQYRYLVVSQGRFKALYFIGNKVIYIAGIWNCKQDISKMKAKFP
jgi:plasmid stabilization system protein ParE